MESCSPEHLPLWKLVDGLAQSRGRERERERNLSSKGRQSVRHAANSMLPVITGGVTFASRLGARAAGADDGIQKAFLTVERAPREEIQTSRGSRATSVKGNKQSRPRRRDGEKILKRIRFNFSRRFSDIQRFIGRRGNDRFERERNDTDLMQSRNASRASIPRGAKARGRRFRGKF